MFFIISKILAFLFNPLFWIVALLMIYKFFKRKKIRFITLTLLITLGIVITNSFLTEEVYRVWEPKAQPDSTLKAKYDAAIILGGGMVCYDQRNDKLVFSKSTDRFLQAMHLYAIGKVKYIIISGGNGNLEEPDLKPEAELIKQFMVENKIPDSVIITETKSRNTHENAGFTKKTLAEHNIKGTCLLLTSAYHMRRSHKCFVAKGVNIVDYPCDRMSGPRHYEIYHLVVPQAQNIMQWDMLIHEWVGYITYKLNGYI